ncbi:TPA: class C sortase [Streptococcus suis]|nr:class C sortase [Streptococcus suis]HEM4766670.1 class C sortase [Streptococcus suis]HEM5168131.1 class C sortase [Streptococcus suis]HEM5178846.1 class C sortase [Streptococcus suis]
MKKFFNHLTTIIILAGIIIVSYPVISQVYYNYMNQQAVSDFDTGVKSLTSEDIQKRMELAKAYNGSLHNIDITDPYTEAELEKGRAEYARMLTVHEKIGSVSVPAINAELPIFAGSSEEVLQKGVGHLEGTSLPIGGNSTHSVLTAHTGLPNARLFTDLDKVKKGDKFFVTNIQETLAYEVDSITVIEPTDFSSLSIVPNEDYVTLLTCTPYMINSHRLLVRGHRIPYNPKEKEATSRKANPINIPPLYLIVFGIISVILLMLFWSNRQSKRRARTNE